jgi:hypothetical protein
VTQAERLFREASDFYRAGRFEEALRQYEQAQQLAPHPANLFNMARCYENLGDPRNALGRYREALAETRDDAERADIERRIANILARPVRVFVATSPPRATVQVDAREQPENQVTPTSVLLTPGPHVLVLRAQGHVPTAHRVVVQVGQEQPVAVELEPLAPCPSCPPPVECATCAVIQPRAVMGHLALRVPAGLTSGPELFGGTQFLGGLGLFASVTYRRVVFDLVVDAFAWGTAPAETGRDRQVALVSSAVTVGYQWLLSQAVLQLTAGLGPLTRFFAADGGSRDFSTSLLGWVSLLLDVYAKSWLSVALDARVGMGGVIHSTVPSKDTGFEFSVILGTQLSFHL